MTILSDPAQVQEKGVHALVIGVGKYPHLLDGNGLPFALPCGMEQLASPPISAQVFAEWLQSSMNLTGAPLRSLDVLASPSQKCQDYAGQWVQVDEPTMANIELAVERWFDAADAHKENIAVVYFCGHGFVVGDVTAFLAQDYGSSKLDPFKCAFDPDAFVSGMLRCKAERQVFLFDACRTVNNDIDFVETYGDRINPRPLVGGRDHHRLGLVKRTVINASRLGTSAYGEFNMPSVFMQCFLQAVRGAGATQTDTAEWVVEPTSLKLGVDWLIKQKLKLTEQCLTFGVTDAADFPIHELPGDPVVPVMIVCAPEPHLERSTLHCSSGDSRNEPSKEPWVIALPMGKYQFRAIDIDSKMEKTSGIFENRPPKLVVSIQCGDIV